MQALADNPALQLYVLTSTLVALQVLSLALYTGRVRLVQKTFVNKEDAKTLGGTHADAEHESVARVRRAHQNAIENAILFFAVGLAYALTGPSKTGAQAYFFTFLAARVLHMIFYIWGKQPFRTLSFGLGVACIVGMAVQVIRVTI